MHANQLQIFCVQTISSSNQSVPFLLSADLNRSGDCKRLTGEREGSV